MSGRAWGIWTKGTLDVLRQYLDAFTTATKNKATETIYIDTFAGEAENRDRLTGEPLYGSARIALSVSNPPFTCLRFFETGRKAATLNRTLRRDFPDRNFEVLAGASNDQVPVELARLEHLNWAPTFAFVDPNAMEAKWPTLVALAEFKKAWRMETRSWVPYTPKQRPSFPKCDPNVEPCGG